MSEAAIPLRMRTFPTILSIHQMIAYGVPFAFWALMLMFPERGGEWVWLVIILLTGYFLIKPTVERVIWVLLPYLFSVGGASFSLSIFDISLRQLPSWVTWLSYIFVPLSILVSLFIYPHWKEREVGLPLFALTLVSVASALIHDSGALSWLGWMLHFVRYPLLFLALVNYPIKKEVYLAWVKTFIGLAYLQIPATILQSLLWRISFSDDILGTMYGAQTSMMGITVSIALCLHLAIVLNAKNPLGGFILLPTLFIPMFLGAANFAVALSILCMVYIIAVWGISFIEDHERLKIRLKKWVGLLANVTIILIVGLLLAIVISFGAESHELTAWFFGTMPNLSTLDAFIKPEYAAFGSRQMFIATTYQWFLKNPSHLWLGSIGPQVGLGTQGATFAQLLGQEGYYPLAYINMAAGFPPNTAQSNVQLPRVLLEVGLVGLSCFLWLYYIPLKKALSIRKSQILSPMAASLSIGFQAVWLIVVVFSIFYVDSWRFDQTSFAFWLIAAAVWKMSQPTLEQKISSENIDPRSDTIS